MTNMNVGNVPQKRIGMVVHPERKGAIEASEFVEAWCEKAGYEVLRVTKASQCQGLSLVLSLGGDGTMLRAIDLCLVYQVPVLGVNFGHLGYLTEIEPPELGKALENFFAGEYELEERMTLDIEISRQPRGATESVHEVERFVALNELVVEKSHSGNVVKLNVSIAGTHFLDYEADGLIVATPTGSTAYSFSARGPVVSPTLRAMIMTPISPHMLFDRALVLDSNEAVEIRVLQGPHATIMVDGINRHVLAPNESVKVRSSLLNALVIKLGKRDFRVILKSKFGLTEKSMGSILD